jgi:hypothetical protein
VESAELSDLKIDEEIVYWMSGGDEQAKYLRRRVGVILHLVNEHDHACEDAKTSVLERRDRLKKHVWECVLEISNLESSRANATDEDSVTLVRK